MVMQRRHLEQPSSFPVAAPGELEVSNLEHHRCRLGDEDGAHHRQEQPLPGHERRDRQRCPDGQRAGIAHDDLRRMRVEPEEAHQRAGHRQAERHHTELSLPVGDDGVGDEGDGGGTRRQGIQPIGEVHRVRHGDDRQRRHRDVEQPDVVAADERQVDAAQAKTVGEWQRAGWLRRRGRTGSARET